MMDSSKIVGGEEECHSSESGWTMYIGSPCIDDGSSYEGDNDKEKDPDTHEAHHPDDESDDSMASDASSGPSHHGRNSDGGFVDFRQAAAAADEEEYDEKYCLDEKAKKQTTERKKDQMIKMKNKGKDAVQQSGGKVRKNHGAGKWK